MVWPRFWTPIWPEIPVTLAGRIGTWQRRRRCDQQGEAWVAWVTHPCFGTIGVAAASPASHAAPPWPSRTRVVIQGAIRPLRVVAQGDDPRDEQDPRAAPVLVRAHAIAASRDGHGGLWLAAPALARRAHTRRWLAHGQVARIPGEIAVYHLSPQPYPPHTPRAWTTVVGVLARSGGMRHLRYVLLDLPRGNALPGGVLAPGGGRGDAKTR